MRLLSALKTFSTVHLSAMCRPDFPPGEASGEALSLYTTGVFPILPAETVNCAAGRPLGRVRALQSGLLTR